MWLKEWSNALIVGENLIKMQQRATFHFVRLNPSNYQRQILKKDDISFCLILLKIINNKADICLLTIEMQSRTPNRFDASPIKRSREFSQIRQDHSQYRPKTSMTGSRNTTYIRPDSQILDHSRNEAKHRNHTENSPTKTLCVGCFNK